jgi:hypothetical protein
MLLEQTRKWIVLLAEKLGIPVTVTIDDESYNDASLMIHEYGIWAFQTTKVMPRIARSRIVPAVGIAQAVVINGSPSMPDDVDMIESDDTFTTPQKAAAYIIRLIDGLRIDHAIESERTRQEVERIRKESVGVF